jgi:predicted DCC family thiol-disulfide oxidoreductase YuxK
MTEAPNSEIALYQSPILVYDGCCGFCSRSVQFMLRHERRHDLLFVTRDSELGRRLRRAWGLESVQSMLWIEGGQVFAKSGAVIKATRSELRTVMEHLGSKIQRRLRRR